MSTVFHVGTYLSMGTDFDSRNRYLRKRADGTYEGVIMKGATWTARPVQGGSDWTLYVRFKMDTYGVDFHVGDTTVPTGTPTRVSSE